MRLYAIERAQSLWKRVRKKTSVLPIQWNLNIKDKEKKVVRKKITDKTATQRRYTIA